MIINFWASWCVPCRNEMPGLQEIHEEGNDDVAVVGINTADRRGDAARFLRDYGVTYPVAYDPSGGVGRKYRMIGMPTTVLVSAQGQVVEKISGEISRDVLRARLRDYFDVNVPVADAPNTAAGRGGIVGLIFRQNLRTLGVLALLGLGFIFGCLHAFGPGHGKSLMAAYLVGGKGSGSDAIVLGCTVAFMHSGSVIVLGTVLYELDRPLEGMPVYFVMIAVLGFGIAATGIRLIVRQLKEARTATVEPDRPDGKGINDFRGVQGVEHDVSHGSHHGHQHALSRPRIPLSRRGLITLGLSGGLFPSPSALVVMVTAMNLGRVVLGLAIVVAFSFGLAVTLSAIGVAIAYGRDVVDRLGMDRTFRLLPLLSSAWLTLMGLALVVQSAIAL